MNPELQQIRPTLESALRISQEALQYRMEQKASRAYKVLHDPTGTFDQAIQAEFIPLQKREWLDGLRTALCMDLY